MKTFNDLCEIEPGLRFLLAAVPALMPASYFDWHQWEAIKRHAYHLVGWGAQNPEIRNCGDWDTAYAALLAEADRCSEREPEAEEMDTACR